MNGNLLIIDDNKSVLTALEMLLQSEFEHVFTLRNPNRLVAAIQQNQIDIVLLDMNFQAGVNSGNEGLYWLSRILQYDPDISVVMITAYGDVELAVKAVKNGAFDFILKPWDNNKLVSTVHAAIKLRKSRIETDVLRKTTDILKQEFNTGSQSIIGRSESLLKVLEIVKKVAGTDANVFITGENGTGKELIAREIHRNSRRSREVMVSVDMGSISESLFESELFGYVKGAFTDAKEDRTGKFEAADKGTLFLDEIGNLPLSLQTKILTALQNRTIMKVGNHKPVPIDIRLVSATNKNLNKMVAEGLFREDLLYRINTITIEVPPLRQRGEDILLLADFYMSKYALKYDKPGLKINQKGREALMDYNWPGNVRELQHSLEKAVILSEGRVLDENSFSFGHRLGQQSSGYQFKTLEEMEKEMITACLEKEHGNLTAVSKKLGITRQTLYNKFKKYGI